MWHPISLSDGWQVIRRLIRQKCQEGIMRMRAGHRGFAGRGGLLGTEVQQARYFLMVDETLN